MDVVHVNEMPFLTSITRALHCRTTLFLKTRTAKDMHATLDEALRLYNTEGFVINKIYCDNEFRTLMDDVKDDLHVDMDCAVPGGHAPEAERNNRTIKERARATFHRLPYKALPKPIMKVLVMEMARKLNFFPNRHGISNHCSPRQILHRRNLNYKHDCKFALGAYVQAHDDLEQTNTQEPRTLDCIYLRPVAQDTHEVFSLKTEAVIKRRSLTELPITQTVIRAVEAIATAQGQQGLRIKTKRGVTLYDSSWTAGVDYTESDSETSDSDYKSESSEESEDLPSDDSYDTSDSEEESEPQAADQAEGILYEDQSTGVRAQQESDQETVPDQSSEDEHSEEAELQSQPTRRSTRIRQPRQLIQPSMTGQSYETVTTPYSHLTVRDEDATLYDPSEAQHIANLMQCYLHKRRTRTQRLNPRTNKHKKHCHVIQHNLNKGLKKFKQAGYEAAKGEMQQLHERDCWSPINVNTLTPTERKKALESLIFLVEKRSGKIKARHCADGSKQRKWMSADDTSSPTVMTESILLTATIEAEEHRDVATFDVPAACIQTEVDDLDADGDRIIMKIRGAMIDMLLEIDPEHDKCVASENGQRVLCIHVLRATYGMLMSGLLYYRKFRASVERIGYEVNPYDPCVANKVLCGKQHTISWHVDDIKSSHVDPKVNDEFYEWLQSEYGQVKPVTSTRGPRHDYLGMTLDYSVPGQPSYHRHERLRKADGRGLPSRSQGKSLHAGRREPI